MDPPYRECGHAAPVVEVFKDVTGEKQEKCHCVNPDTKKLRAKLNAPPAGAQKEMFGEDAQLQQDHPDRSSDS